MDRIKPRGPGFWFLFCLFSLVLSCGGEEPGEEGDSVVAKESRVSDSVEVINPDSRPDSEPDSELAPPQDPSSPSSSESEDVLPDQAGSNVATGAPTDNLEDSDADGVPDTIDACAGTAPASVVNGVGCSEAQLPEPPAPPSADIRSFSVAKVAEAGARISTYRIRFDLGNAKSAFLWGNIFNREAFDAALPASQRCGKIGGRYLLTKSDGSDWIGNEPVFTDPSENVAAFSSGRLCQGADPDAPTGCPVAPPVPEEENDEDNPACRINLVRDEGALVASETLTTRSRVREGRACLAVLGLDSAWKIKCVEVDALEPTLSVAVSVGSTAGVRVTLDYANAAAEPTITWKDANEGGSSSGSCVKDAAASQVLDNRGSGRSVAQCPLALGENFLTQITAKVQGVGASNVETKRLRFKMSPQTLDLDLPTPNWYKDATCDQEGLPFEDCSGNVNLEWRLKDGGYSVKDVDTNQTLLTGSAHWVNSIKIYSGPSLVKTVTPSPNDAFGTVTVRRDHAHTSWRAVAEDVAGRAFGNATVQKKYKARLDVAWHGSFTYGCYIDDCDAWIFEGDCCDGSCDECPSRLVHDCHDHTIHARLDWSGYHLKEVKIDCGGSFDRAASGGAYGYQRGTWTKTHGGTRLDCTITGVGPDGETISKSFWWSGSDNC